ncbi:MAG: hypothetical protein ACRDQA_22585 [Nocardioidaceae bacterium]
MAFQEAYPGVDKEEAIRRIDAGAQRFELNDRLLKTYPNSFGGAWYDGATNLLHLAATTPQASEAFAEVANDAGVPVKVRPVTYSYRDLHARMEQVQQGNDPALSADLAAAAKGHAGLDRKANRVTVSLSDEMLAQTRTGGVTLPAMLKAVPRTTTNFRRNFCDSRRNCGRPLRGGVIPWEGTRDHPLCSLGYIARGVAHPSNKWAITAGHCVEFNQSWGTWKHHIGPVKHKHALNNVDIGLIKIRNTYWLNGTFGWLYHGGHPNDPLKVDGRFTSEGQFVPGQTMCLSARHTSPGNKCGTLFSVNGGDNGMALVRGLDACDGDSGGAWHWYRSSDHARIAAGIHSRSPEPSCHGGGGGNESSFTTLPDMTDIYNILVYTR